MATENSTGRDSDKVMLRLPDGMRNKLAAAAQDKRRSMNAEIVARLDASLSGQSGVDLAPTVSRLTRDLAELEYRMFMKRVAAQNLAFAVGVLLAHVPREHPLFRENRDMIEGWQEMGKEALGERITLQYFDQVIDALRRARTEHPLNGEVFDDSLFDMLVKHRGNVANDPGTLPKGLTMDLDSVGPAVQYRSIGDPRRLETASDPAPEVKLTKKASPYAALASRPPPKKRTPK